MRRASLINEKDLRGKVRGLWISNLPNIFKGGLTSRRRKFLVRLSSILLSLRIRWLKFRGKEVVPMFEIALNPTVSLKEIKERRFNLIEK